MHLYLLESFSHQIKSSPVYVVVTEALGRGRIFRDKCNPFDDPNDMLYQRYRFGLRYISQMMEPNVENVTHLK